MTHPFPDPAALLRNSIVIVWLPREELLSSRAVVRALSCLIHTCWRKEQERWGQAHPLIPTPPAPICGGRQGVPTAPFTCAGNPAWVPYSHRYVSSS